MTEPSAAATVYCPKCGTDRPVSEFQISRQRKDGSLRDNCNRHYREVQLARVNSSLSTDQGLRRAIRHGLYEQLFDEQAGLCRICKRPETARGDDGHIIALSIYVCRRDGSTVIGLVCKVCNIGLSAFGDNPTVLANAIAFITSVGAPRSQTDVRVYDANAAVKVL